MPGYRLFCGFLYRIGKTPWERHPLARQLRRLVEGPDALPPGKALDLGCGSGRDAVYLANHGWDVTGVDATAIALDRARSRAEEAGITASWVLGDVTRLDRLGLQQGFSLVLDVGTYHGLSMRQRQQCSEGVTNLAAPDATLLLLAFAPSFRGPGPRGLSREDVEEEWAPHWKLAESGLAESDALPTAMRNAVSVWYRLERQAPRPAEGRTRVGGHTPRD